MFEVGEFRVWRLSREWVLIFVVDQDIDEKLLISAAPGGYLKRIK